MNQPTTENQNLGIALLIAEFEDGGYEPIAAASTLAEAREMAQSDLRIRARQLAIGEESTCPTLYPPWKRNEPGAFEPAAETYVFSVTRRTGRVREIGPGDGRRYPCWGE